MLSSKPRESSAVVESAKLLVQVGNAVVIAIAAQFDHPASQGIPAETMPVAEDLRLPGAGRCQAEVPGGSSGREIRVMGVIVVQEREERMSRRPLGEPVEQFPVDRRSVLAVEVSCRTISVVRGELPQESTANVRSSEGSPPDSRRHPRSGGNLVKGRTNGCKRRCSRRNRPYHNRGRGGTPRAWDRFHREAGRAVPKAREPSDP